jgi:hypothetical protein
MYDSSNIYDRWPTAFAHVHTYQPGVCEAISFIFSEVGQMIAA